ncbi:hypothetical protein ANN_22580 [Periplaneta americana]|uniref:DUF4817 domain-containing protein n=1 Tax=Periplaneta americana TaxID=6978 RepID=A0ABQ8S8I4_PERAM|nr:hypothetical protein ANN_22580 [Periplaneta americana]
MNVQLQWRREYRTEPPTRLTIARIRDKFETHGTLCDVYKGRSGRPRISSPASSAMVLERFEHSPKKSTKHCVRDGISRTSVRRIINTAKLKVFIPQLLNALNEDDPDRRMQYCEWFRNMVQEDEVFVGKVVWSDEEQCKLNGTVNWYNCVYWCANNLHVFVEKAVNLPNWPSVPERVTSVLPAIRTLYGNEKFYFQQDGVPPHYHRDIRAYLDDNLPGHWIVRRGPIEFPQRSLDLTPGVSQEVCTTSRSAIITVVLKQTRMLSDYNSDPYNPDVDKDYVPNGNASSSDLDTGGGAQNKSVSISNVHSTEEEKNVDNELKKGRYGTKPKYQVSINLDEDSMDPNNSISVIDHKFCVSGHSYIINDSKFGNIEQAARNKVHFVPSNWYETIRTARMKNKFHVHTMTQAKCVHQPFPAIKQRQLSKVCRPVTAQKKTDMLDLLPFILHVHHEFFTSLKTTPDADELGSLECVVEDLDESGELTESSQPQN